MIIKYLSLIVLTSAIAIHSVHAAYNPDLGYDPDEHADYERFASNNTTQKPVNYKHACRYFKKELSERLDNVRNESPQERLDSTRFALHLCNLAYRLRSWSFFSDQRNNRLHNVLIDLRLFLERSVDLPDGILDADKAKLYKRRYHLQFATGRLMAGYLNTVDVNDDLHTRYRTRAWNLLTKASQKRGATRAALVVNDWRAYLIIRHGFIPDECKQNGRSESETRRAALQLALNFIGRHRNGGGRGQATAAAQAQIQQLQPQNQAQALGPLNFHRNNHDNTQLRVKLRENANNQIAQLEQRDEQGRGDETSSTGGESSDSGGGGGGGAVQFPPGPRVPSPERIKDDDAREVGRRSDDGAQAMDVDEVQGAEQHWAPAMDVDGESGEAASEGSANSEKSYSFEGELSASRSGTSGTKKGHRNAHLFYGSDIDSGGEEASDGRMKLSSIHPSNGAGAAADSLSALLASSDEGTDEGDTAQRRPQPHFWTNQQIEFIRNLGTQNVSLHEIRANFIRVYRPATRITVHDIAQIIQQFAPRGRVPDGAHQTTITVPPQQTEVVQRQGSEGTLRSDMVLESDGEEEVARTATSRKRKRHAKNTDSVSYDEDSLDSSEKRPRRKKRRAGERNHTIWTAQQKEDIWNFYQSNGKDLGKAHERANTYSGKGNITSGAVYHVLVRIAKDKGVTIRRQIRWSAEEVRHLRQIQKQKFSYWEIAEKMTQKFSREFTYNMVRNKIYKLYN